MKRQFSYKDPNKICTIFAEYCQKNCTMQKGIIFEQYLHNNPTIFVQYLYGIRTIFDSLGMSQFMKFVEKTIC